MHRSGDWLVPRLAGEPWLEDPPLYHWAGLLLAKLLGWALPLHGAARLASALFVLAAAWLIYYAARHTAATDQRRAAGATAALLLIGSIGLLVHAHEAVPDLASLAGICARSPSLRAPATARSRPASVSAHRWGSRFSPPARWRPWPWAARFW
jgi:4-amino-4-deoxy-L-arabinose transferase-like glycosyltransferase